MVDFRPAKADNTVVNPSMVKFRRFMKNRKFLQRFHQGVLDKGQSAPDKASGLPQTMQIAGIGVGGKEFLVPSFDPATGGVISDPKVLMKRFLPAIQSGEIEGFDSPEEAQEAMKIIRQQIIK
tara:strand:- start:632 stop:1000 length:369 start_codon:yes stop_codon:yes gene_type:complete